MAQKYKKVRIYAIPDIKKVFFIQKIWSYQKKVVPLHAELVFYQQTYFCL